MQELVGRLTALDGTDATRLLRRQVASGTVSGVEWRPLLRRVRLNPQASESLKILAYFDALVDGHANPEVLLRGAAVLSGCAAGVASGGDLCAGRPVRR